MVSTGTNASRFAESNHEAPRRCLCEAFMVQQAHHEGNRIGAVAARLTPSAGV
jgi:hypothetical protein